MPILGQDQERISSQQSSSLAKDSSGPDGRDTTKLIKVIFFRSTNVQVGPLKRQTISNLADQDVKNYLEVFDESFQRVMNRTIDKKDFIQRFYELFLSNSPEAAEKFKKTDMAVQKQLLRQSVSFMLNFSTTLKSSSHLKGIAQLHSKSALDIPPHLYDKWLGSFVETVREYDPQFNRDIEIAWTVILAPGIAYMKYHYEINPNLKST